MAKKNKQNKKAEEFDARANRKVGDELTAYLAFKRKGSVVPSKKGKGSYNRKAFKQGD